MKLHENYLEFLQQYTRCETPPGQFVCCVCGKQYLVGRRTLLPAVADAELAEQLECEAGAPFVFELCDWVVCRLWREVYLRVESD